MISKLWTWLKEHLRGPRSEEERERETENSGW